MFFCGVYLFRCQRHTLGFGVFLMLGVLPFISYVYLGIAGLAPLARYSLSTATKSTQKRPPRQLRPCKRHRGSHLASIIIMLRQNSPTLKNTYAQTCWHRKPMITILAKWLAKVGWKPNEKMAAIFRLRISNIPSHSLPLVETRKYWQVMTCQPLLWHDYY